jgi:hypothetical protein
MCHFLHFHSSIFLLSSSNGWQPASQHQRPRGSLAALLPHSAIPSTFSAPCSPSYSPTAIAIRSRGCWSSCAASPLACHTPPASTATSRSSGSHVSHSAGRSSNMARYVRHRDKLGTVAQDLPRHCHDEQLLPLAAPSSVSSPRTIF